MRAYQRIGLIAAVVSAGVLTAKADNWLSEQSPFADYGQVYNTDSGMAGGNAVLWCAPTATINSFVFLENYYPQIYGFSLTGGNAIQARNSLAQGWFSPGAMWRSGMVDGLEGSSDESFWEHKVQWIEDFAPNTTVFGGMIDSADNPVGWYEGSLLTWAAPTWQYLWGEVGDKEDIELKIDTGTSIGHAITMIGMKFNDTNGDRQWDNGETADIVYIDPNGPNPSVTALVAPGADGRLHFTWNHEDVSIQGAFTESVPEPATVSLLVLGLAALLRRRLLA